MEKTGSRVMKIANVLILVLAFSASLHAQIDPLQAPGLAPAATYQHSDIDSVNMQNGLPTIHIPIYSLPQRGRLSLSFSLSGSGMAFGSRRNSDCTLTSYKCYMVAVVPTQTVGMTWDQPLGAGPTSYRYPPNSLTFYFEYSIKDSTGASHLLGYDNSNRRLLRTTDGSGLLYAPGDPTPWYPSGSSANNVIYQPDGIQQIINPNTLSQTIQDPDGNSIVKVNGQITDSVGRTIPAGPTIPVSSTAGCPTVNANWQPTTSSSTWTVPGANSTQQTYLFCYTTITYRTNFWPNYPPTCYTQCQELTGTANYMLQSVVLPNGTYWAFTYDAANPADTSSIGYGQITQIRLPMGGTISYQYVNYYQTCKTPPSLGRAVSQRTLDPGNGGPVQTWSYSFPYINSLPWLTNATDALGNDTVYTFSSAGGGCDVYETKRQSYQGSQSSGTLLKTTTTTYQSAAGNPQSGIFTGGNGNTLAVLPTSVTTTLQNGLAATTSLQYNDSGFIDVQPGCRGPSDCTWSATQPVAYGRVTSSSTTDYSGTTLKTVQTQYQYQQSSSYFAANFLDLASSSTT